ncbi:SPFH domain-containing protein [Pseudosulfitobacter pseudonitzschiae]|uniref:SPFH domain-containing protein n=1 Tax=Pseudosulfitobacter pseudonitzschiae TaxID=1402135 RepID=UPI003B7F9AE1
MIYLWAIPIVIAVFLLLTMIVITGQQNVRMIETFGKFRSIRSAGLSFKLPWPIQTASREFSLKQLQLAEDVGVKSIDNAFLNVPIKLQYRVNPELASDAYYKLDKPEEQIRSYIVNQVRATAGGLSFEDLFKSRDTFEGDVAETLCEKMAEFGYIIVNVLVDDPQPSQQLREAFDRVISSQRLREAATNEGEAARIMSVAKAEAEGEALKIKGSAYAEFRKTVAEGNAEALNKFVGETGLTPKDGLTFFNSINEMEAVRDAAQYGGKTVFIAAAAKTESAAAVMGMVAGTESDNASSSRAEDQNGALPD